MPSRPMQSLGMLTRFPSDHVKCRVWACQLVFHAITRAADLTNDGLINPQHIIQFQLRPCCRCAAMTAPRTWQCCHFRPCQGCTHSHTHIRIFLNTPCSPGHQTSSPAPTHHCEHGHGIPKLSRITRCHPPDPRKLGTHHPAERSSPPMRWASDGHRMGIRSSGYRGIGKFAISLRCRSQLESQ